MRILLLGGAGFIGRHTTSACLRAGHEVIVGTRNPSRAGSRLPLSARGCERRRIRFEKLLVARAWLPLLADVDVVINCVGILRPRWGETYDRIHHEAVAALADACREAGVRRLVHVSALGLHADASSGFLLSKLRGEQSLRARRMDAVIVRPSLLEGDDGFGARWLRRVSRWPVHFVPAPDTARIAPLHVRDLADALCALCLIEASATVREFDLGGDQHRTLKQHLAQLRQAEQLPVAAVIKVPVFFARIVAHVCDLLHVTPFSFGHLELLAKDNLPSSNALPRLLNRRQQVKPAVASATPPSAPGARHHCARPSHSTPVEPRSAADRPSPA